MPEEIVWNKKLLVVALVLGAVAAILFFAYDARMQQKLTGDTVEALRWRRSLRVGSEIAQSDINVVREPRQWVEQVGGVLLNRASDLQLLSGDYVSRNVYKGDYVRSSDLLSRSSNSPSQRIGDDTLRAMTLRVDPANAPGDMLRVTDRVDIIALVSLGDDTARSYPILENVRVLAIGGVSEEVEDSYGPDPGGPRRQPPQRAYRSVTIELSQETAVKLPELLARVQGRLWVALRRPPRGQEAAKTGGINPELEKLLEQPVRSE